MESGYVRFFNSADGKLFGFVVDEMGNDLFFHYSDGRIACLTETKDVRLVEATTPMQFPKKGDRLVFARSSNAKGPKARPWAFEQQFNRVVESAKRALTLDEAREYLGGMLYDVFAHTEVTNSTNTLVETREMKWFTPDGKSVVGRATFTTTSTRRGDGWPFQTIQSYRSITVYAPDVKRFVPQSIFVGTDLVGFRNLGTPRKVVSGRKCGVLWNGGWDDYVVDAENVRSLTDDEARKNLDSPFPTFQDDDGKTWLRCRFTPGLGNQTQAMRVLAHLGGGD